ncbi:unnamed protein product, partial [Ixodes pacificus]
EVSNDLLTAVQWEETSRDSDGELSADSVLPVGLLPTSTEGKAGANMLNDCEGAFVTPLETMSTSARIKDRPLPSTSEWAMVEVTEHRLNDEIPKQASQLNGRKGATKEDPLISCDRSGRWAYISETEFETHEEAEGDHFVCRTCKAIDEIDKSHRTRMDDLADSVNVIIQKLEDATPQGEPNETTTIRKLQDRMAELEHRVEELQKALDSILDGVSLTTTVVNCEKNSERDAGENRRKEDQKDLAILTQYKDLLLLRKDGKEQDIVNMTGSETVDDCSKTVCKLSAENVTTSEQGESEEVQDNSCSRSKSSPATKGTTNAGKVKDRPPRGVKREVLLVGDSNVERIAQAFIEKMDDKRSVEVLLNRKATTEDAHSMIAEYERQARMVSRMYILHVGLNDVLRGDQPDHVVETIRRKWSRRKAALAICSVPEVTSKGKVVQASVMLRNAKLKVLCKKIHAKFVDFSREVAANDGLQKDGLLYGHKVISLVSHRIAEMASLFLDRRRGRWYADTGKERGKEQETSETQRGKMSTQDQSKTMPHHQRWQHQGVTAMSWTPPVPLHEQRVSDGTLVLSTTGALPAPPRPRHQMQDIGSADCSRAHGYAAPPRAHFLGREGLPPPEGFSHPRLMDQLGSVCSPRIPRQEAGEFPVFITPMLPQAPPTQHTRQVCGPTQSPTALQAMVTEIVRQQLRDREQW